jgi:hypothetical protein
VTDDQKLLPFIDAEAEARSLLEHYSPAMVVEWIGRYEFLVEQLEAYQRELQPGNVSYMIEHARKVLELLKANCKAGERIG